MRLRKRNTRSRPIGLFPGAGQRELFNTILDEEELKLDRDGKRRTAYSLRHTYICLRLMEGADIYQIAKNCRTSVEMIENFMPPSQDDAGCGSDECEETKGSQGAKAGRPHL
jgi:hypothetical protein